MNYTNRLHRQVIMVAILLLMTNGSFAQEKLPITRNAGEKRAAAVNYIQQVTDLQTPITDIVSANTDSPRFIQAFSPEKSLLSSEMKAWIPSPPQVDLSFPENALPLGVSGMHGMNNLETILCGDRPFGMEDAYAIGSDLTLTVDAPGFLANDIDFEGEALAAVSIADDTDHGMLSAFTNGLFFYFPDEGFVGTDQFQYVMKDASDNLSDPITVTIEVLDPVNRPPIGTDDAFGALSNTTLSVPPPGFLANDIDLDGEPLAAIQLPDDVDHGILTAYTDGSFTYTPVPGFTGIDQFQYIMQDLSGNISMAITVTITVFEGNRKPLGTDDIFATVVNTVLTIPDPGFLFNDIDPDGDLLSATTIVDNVDHGTLTAYTNGSFTYNPNTGFMGTDQFQYLIQDIQGNSSEPITVTLEVITFGTLPFGFADTYRTADGSTLSVPAPGFLFNDIDQNGEPLTAVSISDNVDHGTLEAFANGSFNYTPNSGFTGIDQFQYNIRDASSNFAGPVSVTIIVEESYNRSPHGVDDRYAALSNTTLSVEYPGFLGNDIDPDGDIILATLIVDGVDHGTLTAYSNGAFDYTPESGFTGTDQFEYQMRDVFGNVVESATVTIDVYQWNRIPMGINDIFAAIKNTTLNIDAAGFLANDYDPDLDAITATLILDNPDHGALSAYADGSFIYTPEADFTGTDQFQYQMRDAYNNFVGPVTVVLEVFGANVPPVASALDVTMECTGSSGTMVTLDGSGSYDPDNDALVYTWYENGSVIAGPSDQPTAEVAFPVGEYLVILTVADECGLTSSHAATVNISDASGPIVEAALLPYGNPKEFEVSCYGEDLCSEIISSTSVILIPELIGPGVNLVNSPVYSLVIDLEENTVDVKAPDAATFWSMILMNGGVQVSVGQVIEAKSEKKKYKYSFDSQGTLVSVKGETVTLRCTATDEYGNTGMDEAMISADKSTALENAMDQDRNEEFMGLHRSYPNPFGQSTTIQYRLERPSHVSICVLDHLGRVIKQLESRKVPEGIHQVVWDASAYAPGIYFYRIQVDGNQFTGRMIHFQQ